MTTKEMIDSILSEGWSVMITQWPHRLKPWDVMLINYERIEYINTEQHKTRAEAIRAAWKKYHGER